jgi:hypothetical protein
MLPVLGGKGLLQDSQVAVAIFVTCGGRERVAAGQPGGCIFHLCIPVVGDEGLLQNSQVAVAIYVYLWGVKGCCRTARWLYPSMYTCGGR